LIGYLPIRIAAAVSVIAGPTAVRPNLASYKGLILVTAGDVAHTVITKTLKNRGNVTHFIQNKQPKYSEVQECVYLLSVNHPKRCL